MINILLLEDNTVISARFQGILQNWSEVNEIHLCYTLKEALALISNQSIDLLIADIGLPDGSGIDAISALHKNQPTSIAIVISALADQAVVVEALQAGAVGYIQKDDEPINIIEICTKAMNGCSPMSTGIARQIVNLIQTSNFHQQNKPSANDKALLTPREVEILTSISKGYSYKETAELSQISVQTVSVHVRNIYKKLQVNNRSEASFEAKELGLIPG